MNVTTNENKILSVEERLDFIKNHEAYLYIVNFKSKLNLDAQENITSEDMEKICNLMNTQHNGFSRLVAYGCLLDIEHYIGSKCMNELHFDFLQKSK